MTKRTAGIALGLAMLAAGMTGARAGKLGLNGRFEVGEVVADYRPADDVLALSVTLTAGIVLEYETKERAAVASILAMIDAFARSGSARMFVIVEGDRIDSFQISARGAR